MGQIKLPDGLVWRKKPDGSFCESIYFDKQYAGRRLRGCSKTSSIEEAERRLRKKLDEIDNAIRYKIRPNRTFEEAAAHYLETDPNAWRHVSHLESMMPYVGKVELSKMSKAALLPWINVRREVVSAKTINWGIEAVRRILRLCSEVWRDEHGLTWLSKDDLLKIEFEQGPKLLPYPLSWEEQFRFFPLLPERLRDMALLAVNTGCREQEIIKLRWEWEKDVGIGETVFVVPGDMRISRKNVKGNTKNRKPHYVILNSVARAVIERRRGIKQEGYEEYVFGKPIDGITCNAWYAAWLDAIGPVPGYLKGVHNLKHTFGKRLRDAGVDERDVQDLLHHMPKTVTRGYSQPELKNLRECVERIVLKPQLRAVI